LPWAVFIHCGRSNKRPGGGIVASARASLDTPGHQAKRAGLPSRGERQQGGAVAADEGASQSGPQTDKSAARGPWWRNRVAAGRQHQDPPAGLLGGTRGDQPKPAGRSRWQQPRSRGPVRFTRSGACLAVTPVVGIKHVDWPVSGRSSTAAKQESREAAQRGGGGVCLTWARHQPAASSAHHPPE